MARDQNISRDHFLSHFAKEGTSEDVSGLVYDILQREHPETLRPQGAENFKEALRIDPDDLEDDIRSLLTTIYPTASFEEVANEWLGGEIKSVEDLIRWVHWVKYSFTPRKGQFNC